MLKISSLDYIPGKGQKPILKNINLSIEKGEFVAVIGQNGAGKTTLLKQLNGLLKPTQGQVSLNGLDTKKYKVSTLARTVGYLFQNPDNQIFSATVYQEIEFGIKKLYPNEPRMESKVREIAAYLGLSEKLAKNPFSLSRGERQRVALASVLVLETDILVLDEPTTGQDYQECLEIMDIIKNLNSAGKTIIMVSHDMEVVSDYARRVIILDRGEILEDGPTYEVLRKPLSLQKAGLRPPQIIQLALSLEASKDQGGQHSECQHSFDRANTVQDFFDVCLRLRKERLSR